MKKIALIVYIFIILPTLRKAKMYTYYKMAHCFLIKFVKSLASSRSVITCIRSERVLFFQFSYIFEVLRP